MKIKVCSKCFSLFISLNIVIIVYQDIILSKIFILYAYVFLLMFETIVINKFSLSLPGEFNTWL